MNTAAFNYMLALDAYSRSEKSQFESAGDPSETSDQLQMLRRARIFAVNVESFNTIHSRCSEIAMNTFVQERGYELDSNSRYRFSREEATSWLLAHRPTIPFPDRLPFESVFLTFTDGVVKLKPEALAFRATDRSFRLHVAKHGILGNLLGYIISKEDIYEVIFLKAHPSMPETFFCAGHYDREYGWLKPASLMPWAVPMLVDHINGHNTVIEESIPKAQRREIKKKLKRTKDATPPREFYTVRLDRRVLNASAKRLTDHQTKRSYRSDVRGHESIRVQRGSMPMDEKTREKLLKRGYQVYAESVVPPEVEAKIAARGKPARAPGEWVAVLSWWRESFVSPKDESLPLVRAVREAKRVPSRKKGSRG